MSTTLIYVAVVLALILVEGLFVAAEIALVSLREGQAKALAEKGWRGVAVAKLTSDPNRFLATVQIGVTSTALLSSAFGAVTLSGEAKNALVRQGLSKGLAGALGVVGVTLAISFVTLVLGELAPKRLALQRTEAAAGFFAPTLNRLASIFRPVIWLLSAATDLVVRILGGDPSAGREAITEEELRGLVATHESLTKDERRLIDEVFAAGERSVSEVMRPRNEVTFLEAALTVSRATRIAAESAHSRFPVISGGQDDVIGFVHIRDLVLGGAENGRTDTARTVADLVREIKRLPGSKKVLSALSEMRREHHHMAIVVDEYGGTDGIVTLEDLIEEVIGEIRDEYDESTAPARRLADGAVDLDGKSNLDEVDELAGVELPDGPYDTVGGYVMARLGRIPRLGDVVRELEHTFTVTEVDGRRASRVQVAAAPSGEAAHDAVDIGERGVEPDDKIGSRAD